MRLIDDDRVVGRQPAVGLDLGQQNAVGHEFDRSALAHVLVETHLKADRSAERRLQFLGNAARDRARSDPSRLSATDQPGRTTASGETQLRQLRGLARTGFARDHHDLMVANQGDDALGFGRDRQRLVDFARRRQKRNPRLARGDRHGQGLSERALRSGIGRLRIPARPQPKQAATVARQRVVYATAGLLRFAAVVLVGIGHQRRIWDREPVSKAHHSSPRSRAVPHVMRGREDRGTSGLRALPI